MLLKVSIWWWYSWPNCSVEGQNGWPLLSSSYICSILLYIKVKLVSFLYLSSNYNTSSISSDFALHFLGTSEGCDNFSNFMRASCSFVCTLSSMASWVTISWNSLLNFERYNMGTVTYWFSLFLEFWFAWYCLRVVSLRLILCGKYFINDIV